MRVIEPKTNLKTRRRKVGYWDGRKTEKTVFVLEIEHDSACDKQALAVMFENGAGSNVKTIKVCSVEGVE